MTTTAAPAAFTLTATFERETGSAPQQVQAVAIVPTLAAAQAIAALFPKSHKVRATTLTRPIGDDLSANGTEVVGYVSFEVGLNPTGNNGGRNETGIKRYRAFRKAVDRLGFPVEFDGRERCVNAYRTEAALDAAIDA